MAMVQNWDQQPQQYQQNKTWASAQPWQQYKTSTSTLVMTTISNLTGQQSQQWLGSSCSLMSCHCRMTSCDSTQLGPVVMATVHSLDQQPVDQQSVVQSLDQQSWQQYKAQTSSHGNSTQLRPLASRPVVSSTKIGPVVMATVQSLDQQSWQQYKAWTSSHGNSAQLRPVDQLSAIQSLDQQS